jgi:hypothetical protein
MKSLVILARNFTFALLCVFVTLPLGAAGYQQLEPRPDDGQGLVLLERVLDVQGGSIVERSGWVDLYGDRAYDEFFALYHRDSGDYDLVIVSRRNSRNTLLYNNEWSLNGMEDYTIEFFERNARPQILLVRRAGGGGFLDVSILEYDGTALKTVYQTDEVGEDGWYYFVNQRLLFSGGGGKYALSFKDGVYRLLPYNNIEGYTASNAVRFVLRQDQFAVYFNDKPLPFLSRDEAYYAPQPVEVPLNDWVLFNDNLNGSVPAGATPPGAIKSFVMSEAYESIEWWNGFYGRFRFTQPGTYEMAFRFDYTFYHVNFVVK